MSLPTDAAARIVAALYQALLEREPDASGLAHRRAALDAGRPVGEVIAAIRASEECARREAGRARASLVAERIAAEAARRFAQRPMTIVDVGAQELAGEAHAYSALPRYGIGCRVIGFEPLVERLREREESDAEGNLTLLPYFIGDGGSHTFHVNNDDATSSLLPLNPAVTGELDQLDHLRTLRRETVATRTLDEALDGEPRIDFLKLDIQGFELPALRNATAVLARTNVIHCEVAFTQIYAGQALFSDVEAFLREQGFVFVDFATQCRYAYRDDAGVGTRDRLGWADAVFFRDAGRLSDPDDLLSQAVIAAGVYGKASLAAHLAALHDRVSDRHIDLPASSADRSAPGG